MPISDDIRHRIKAQGVIGHLLTIKTEKAAKRSIEAMYRGKTEVVVGIINKISLNLLKIIPVSICTKIATKTIKRELR